MTAHEVAICLGRPFDVQVRGEFRSVTEITIPFLDRESAEAAFREVEVSVRAVHDAGGEDYRPVVAGEVIPADFERAIAEQERRMRASILAPKPDLGDGGRADLARDMRDLAEMEANSARPQKVVYCAGNVPVAGLDYSQPGHPRRMHAGGTLCDHLGGAWIGDASEGKGA